MHPSSSSGATDQFWAASEAGTLENPLNRAFLSQPRKQATCYHQPVAARGSGVCVCCHVTRHASTSATPFGPESRARAEEVSRANIPPRHCRFFAVRSRPARHASIDPRLPTSVRSTLLLRRLAHSRYFPTVQRLLLSSGAQRAS
ncbi:hypothetical protein MRX96_003675 [Rhipicephalus microplus]